MSFRQYGGLQFSSKNNYNNLINVTSNVDLPKTIGTPNTTIDVLSKLNILGGININVPIDYTNLVLENLTVNQSLTVPGSSSFSGPVFCTNTLTFNGPVDASNFNSITGSIIKLINSTNSTYYTNIYQDGPFGTISTSNNNGIAINSGFITLNSATGVIFNNSAARPYNGYVDFQGSGPINFSGTGLVTFDGPVTFAVSGGQVKLNAGAVYNDVGGGESSTFINQNGVAGQIHNNHNLGSIRLSTKNIGGVPQDNVYALNGNQGGLQGDFGNTIEIVGTQATIGGDSVPVITKQPLTASNTNEIASTKFVKDQFDQNQTFTGLVTFTGPVNFTGTTIPTIATAYSSSPSTTQIATVGYVNSVIPNGGIITFIPTNTSGTYLVNATVNANKRVKIVCIGAGGGGGGPVRMLVSLASSQSSSSGGGGGGGGGITIVDIILSEDTTFTYSIGTGGTGGSVMSATIIGISGNSGVNGGDSYVSNGAVSPLIYYAYSTGGGGGSPGFTETYSVTNPQPSGGYPGVGTQGNGGTGGNGVGINGIFNTTNMTGGQSSLIGAGGGGGGGASYYLSPNSYLSNSGNGGSLGMTLCQSNLCGGGVNNSISPTQIIGVGGGGGGGCRYSSGGYLNTNANGIYGSGGGGGGGYIGTTSVNIGGGGNGGSGLIIFYVY